MLEIKNVSVSFGAVRAIDDVSFTVAEKTTTVVVGESGSGKSVMLSAIMHILPDTANVAGSILLNGEELLDKTEKQMQKIRGNALSYIPQGSGTSMNPLLKVGLQVAEPLMEKKKEKKSSALQKAVEWMKALNLGNEIAVAASYPHTLSGGMRQRALIAMGAISGAPLLLADEPTKGLDGERVETVTDIFNELQDRTVLCVSHDLNFTRAIADNVVVMYASQMVESCSNEEFFEQPLHPYSQMILLAMPENGLQINMGFAPPQTDRNKGGCLFYSRCPYASDRCLKTPPLIETGSRKVRCWKYAD